MKKKEAINNLKFIVWLFLILGLMAVFSAVYYIGKTDNILESIFNFIFGLCMFYLSYKIQSSAKSLE